MKSFLSLFVLKLLNADVLTSALIPDFPYGKLRRSYTSYESVRGHLTTDGFIEVNEIDLLKINNKINNVFIEPPKISRQELLRGEYNSENQIFIRPFTIPKKHEKLFQEIMEKNILNNTVENIQKNPRIVISRKLPVSIDTDTPENMEKQNDDSKKNYDKKKKQIKQKIDTSSPLYQINELLLTIVQYYIAYLLLHNLLG